LRDKGSANLSAFIGSDRDILQIWIGAAQSAGGGDRLIVGGVDTSGFRMNQVD
jgi:hypothetical protein